MQTRYVGVCFIAEVQHYFNKPFAHEYGQGKQPPVSFQQPFSKRFLCVALHIVQLLVDLAQMVKVLRVSGSWANQVFRFFGVARGTEVELQR